MLGSEEGWLVLSKRFMVQGVTLIELVVGLAILAILVTRALPSFSTWLQNLQIRNTAESILNGLQLAKVQAVKTNVAVEFVLTAAEPTKSNVGASASTGGPNWIVRSYKSDGEFDASADFVQGRSTAESSKNAKVSADQASFVFTPLGRLVNPPAGTEAKIDVTSSLSYEGRRPMRVIVSAGGQVLMCDPNMVDASNPQFCPAS